MFPFHQGSSWHGGTSPLISTETDSLKVKNSHMLIECSFINCMILTVEFGGVVKENVLVIMKHTKFLASLEKSRK